MKSLLKVLLPPSRNTSVLLVLPEALEELVVSCPTDEAQLRPQQDFYLELQQELK